MVGGFLKIELIILFCLLCSFVSAETIEIYNCNGLQSMNGNLSGHYELANDIDCSMTGTWNEGQGFDPIGNSSYRFTGYFEGQNYTVSNLRIARDQGYVGLFGYAKNVIIKNVGILNVQISITSASSQYYIGALVGRGDYTNITNSYSTGYVNTTGGDVGGLAGLLIGKIEDSNSSVYVRGNVRIGGLVGQLQGSAINSYATGDIYGGTYTGGLIGDATDSVGGNLIYNCSATGDIVRASLWSGGLVGKALEINIENSYATGMVNASITRDYIGGLVGYLQDSNLSKSYATGDVMGRDYLGGLIGRGDGHYTNATVVNSYALGDIHAQAYNGYAGGLAGFLYNVNIVNSYATGTVNSNGDSVGGLIGRIINYSVQPILVNSYSTGYVGGRNEVGGLIGEVGWNFDKITNVYFYSNVSDCCGSGVCTDCTRESLISAFYGQGHDVYTSWDFNNIWQNHPDGFPTLRDCFKIKCLNS